MDPILVALALGAAFCFAMGLVLTRIGLDSADPVGGGAVSVPTTALIFLAASPLTVNWDAWQTDSALMFAGAGLIFPVAVTLLTFQSTQRIGPNLTGALGNLTPLFAVALAVLWLGEVPRTGQLIGTAVISAGVVLIFVGRGRGAAFPAWALALPLAAACVRGLAQPMVKAGLGGWPNPFAAVTIGYAISATVILIVAASRKRGLSYTRRGIRRFVPVGFANGSAVFLMYAALARGPVSIVAPLIACYPLFTLALDRLLIGRGNLTRFTLAGILVSVGGVVVLLMS
ncbi:MAG: DMT family transporter [Rhodospirillaceae bacterium]